MYLKIIYMLSPREQNRTFLLLIMNLIMSLIEMIGVASIMPFIAVLTNPEIIETNSIIQKLFEISISFGVDNTNEFIIFLGVLVFLLLIFSLSFKILLIFIMSRFIMACQYNLAKRLVEGYLNQPYSWFLNRHTADLTKTVLSEVGTVVQKGLGSLMTLISRIFVVIALFSLLVLVNPKISIIISITLLVIYGLVYKSVRNFIKRIGEERLIANSWIFTALSEAFGGVKEIKVGGLEKIYTNRFSKPAMILAKHSAMSAILSRVPRFLIEICIFGGMILISIYLVYKGGTFNNAIPLLAIYAFAGYKMIPAIQDIYNSLTQLRFASASVDALEKDMKNLKTNNLFQSKNVLEFKKNIELKKIYYNYPNSAKLVLNNLNLNIPVGNRIGFVGTTGSGKTTIADIILGLLEPQKGTLEVDGQEINKNNCRSWQRCIGYVPQHIFLADETVAANIAFGADHKNIDYKKIENASKIANLQEFVDELPKKYETFIGERGVRLSGGQRQRIGIARALYHNPKLLILDEATSALDNTTENTIMNSINNIDSEVTIILIAHRLTTLRDCDKIFLLDNGKLETQGTFEELLKSSDKFRIMAENKKK